MFSRARHLQDKRAFVVFIKRSNLCLRPPPLRGPVSKKRAAAKAILADLDRDILPGEKKKKAALNPGAVLDRAVADHAPRLAGPMCIRAVGQSGGGRGGGIEGACPTGGGDSSGTAQSDAGEGQNSAPPAAGGSDDDMEGGGGEDEADGVEEEVDAEELRNYFYNIPEGAKKRLQEVNNHGISSRLLCNV